MSKNQHLEDMTQSYRAGLKNDNMYKHKEVRILCFLQGLDCLTTGIMCIILMLEI